MLRESFRLMPQTRSEGYDLVIVVRPHEPLELAAYQKLLPELLVGVAAQWNKKVSRKSGR